MKIFRKSRFSAITKTSASKYILYAIGEIILVVIGILIALYLNNKKEDADRLEKQRTHLILIKEELQNNIAILEKEDTELDHIIRNIKDLINLTISKQSIDTISETGVSEILFLPLTRAIDVNYENGAFNDFVISSGLKDIRNDSIKTMLRSWDRALKTLDLQEDVVKKFLDKAVDFVELNGSFKTIYDTTDLSENYFEINNSPELDSNKPILSSKQFKNILVEYLGVSMQLHNRSYPDFKSEAELLIKLIEDELKKH